MSGKGPDSSGGLSEGGGTYMPAGAARRREGLLSREQPDSTRHRLIEAGQQLFAKHGYSGAGVRDITTAAGTNIASVNYHFGGKEALYIAVFERMLTGLRNQRVEAVAAVMPEARRSGDLELVLRAFCEAFMRPLADPQRAADMLSLYLMEVASPRLPAGMFKHEMVEPMERLMIDAMQVVAPGLSREDAVLSMHSMVGQLVHLVQHWRLERGGEAVWPGQEEVQQKVSHVVRFTAAGIRDRMAGGSDVARQSA
jgi:AcrR family transcriptional regulator